MSHNGYGQTNRNGKNIRAHRYTYEQAFGPIPMGLVVMHDCPGGDNPRCVNPAHLKLGTVIENRADCVAKQRHARGAKMAGAKLTDEQVVAIRSLAAQGIQQEVIAQRFGITQPTVGNIASGKTWKHVARLEQNHDRHINRRAFRQLTDAERTFIQQRLEAGESRHVIAADMGISHVTVWRVGKPDKDGRNRDAA